MSTSRKFAVTGIFSLGLMWVSWKPGFAVTDGSLLELWLLRWQEWLYSFKRLHSAMIRILTLSVGCPPYSLCIYTLISIAKISRLDHCVNILEHDRGWPRFHRNKFNRCIRACGTQYDQIIPSQPQVVTITAQNLPDLEPRVRQHFPYRWRENMAERYRPILYFCELCRTWYWRNAAGQPRDPPKAGDWKHNRVDGECFVYFLSHSVGISKSWIISHTSICLRIINCWYIGGF